MKCHFSENEINQSFAITFSACAVLFSFDGVYSNRLFFRNAVFCYHIKLSAESHFKNEPHKRHINALTELHFPFRWWPIYRGRNKEWQRQKLHQFLIRFGGLCQCRTTAKYTALSKRINVVTLAEMKLKSEGESIEKWTENDVNCLLTHWTFRREIYRHTYISPTWGGTSAFGKSCFIYLIGKKMWFGFDTFFQSSWIWGYNFTAIFNSKKSTEIQAYNDNNGSRERHR